MKREIRIVDETRGIAQITCPDERWYLQEERDDNDAIVAVHEFPSVTWITHYYPKGKGYEQWLAKNGIDDATAIRDAAGDRGHKVHQLITQLLTKNDKGETAPVELAGQVKNSQTGEPEDISAEEYGALMSFADWFNQVKPNPLANEQVVFNAMHGYAGTVDFVCDVPEDVKIGRTIMPKGRWLIDFKTSQTVYPSHELQVAAYKHALKEYEIDHLGILQIGYKKNERGWKLTEVEDQFELFLATKQIWQKECGNVRIFQKDYPTSLQLTF